MSYSSIANKSNINTILETEIKKEDKDKQIINECENHKALINTKKIKNIKIQMTYILI